MIALISTFVGLMMLVLGWIIYGLIIGASKKGGEHVWENKDEYHKKGTELWKKGKEKWNQPKS